ncbi:MAG: hypothetical protein N0E58_08065 [Candidatus Thiodiazotropha endolucinida]|uniref:Uncharacterized protein n=1 Tax=Candidatus Thiodiazotropha taylori TaxID=2792791 RepID=A0A9E4NIX5_9GAMM|nr:hypothetical protein [Candidatus Thiodiazotropha taylori]MCW4236205.1 hypothetical protein [Candidatus Thiodiazotropha endolucinida]
MSINYIIYALGMKGVVIEKVFVPYREKDGTFPIFSEELQKKNGSDKLQKAENKVKGIVEVAEAVRLMREGGYRWRLKEYGSGQVNIYKPEHLVVHEL